MLFPSFSGTRWFSAVRFIIPAGRAAPTPGGALPPYGQPRPLLTGTQRPNRTGPNRRGLCRDRGTKCPLPPAGSAFFWGGLSHVCPRTAPRPAAHRPAPRPGPAEPPPPPPPPPLTPAPVPRTPWTPPPPSGPPPPRGFLRQKLRAGQRLLRGKFKAGRGGVCTPGGLDRRPGGGGGGVLPADQGPPSGLPCPARDPAPASVGVSALSFAPPPPQQQGTGFPRFGAAGLGSFPAEV